MTGNSAQVKVDTAEGESVFSAIFIKNLDFDVDSASLYNAFREFGKVLSARVLQTPAGASRGLAFVTFQGREQGANAQKAMDGALLGSKLITVRAQGPKFITEQSLSRLLTIPTSVEAQLHDGGQGHSVSTEAVALSPLPLQGEALDSTSRALQPRAVQERCDLPEVPSPEYTPASKKTASRAVGVDGQSAHRETTGTNAVPQAPVEAYTLTWLASLPARDILVVIREHRGFTGLIAEADPVNVRKTDDRFDELLSLSENERRGTVANELRKAVKAFEPRAAVKKTMQMIYSEDLRSLVQLMDNYPGVLREKVAQTVIR